MRWLILTAVAATLASCIPAQAPEGAGFASELALRAPGPPRTCIGTFADEHVYPIDSTTVAYGHGRTIYVNRLPGPCPALSQHNIIVTESHGGMYCRGDTVRGAEPGALIAGPRCNLGDWVPYTMR